MSFLRLDDIHKSFGEQVVLAGISLAVEEAQTLVLLGPSGSGKTTLLRILAGFERPERGRVEIDGRDVGGLKPARRNFGMVFQHYALFPHLTVAQNIGFGLAARGTKGPELDSRVGEMLELVELAGFEARAIHEISGGQQQRVALARALAPAPRVLLLDEPLSNLDPGLRERTRRQLRSVLRRVGITAIWVTHEQQEAFDVGDRIALLDDGRVQQLGTAEDLYARPVSPFVADFVGHSSWLRGRGDGTGRVVLAPGVSWEVSCDGDPPAGEVDILLRPEDARLVDPAAGALVGTVRQTRFVGHTTYVEVELAGGALVLVTSVHVPARETKVGVEPLGGRPSPRAFERGSGDR
ncbi:MAG: ABC transporter ATP-binding protein [Acidobacteria bacterium]|nr:ABC transporter ATP-binding protein [Acidobacteriota bacterium]